MPIAWRQWRIVECEPADVGNLQLAKLSVTLFYQVVWSDDAVIFAARLCRPGSWSVEFKGVRFED